MAEEKAQREEGSADLAERLDVLIQEMESLPDPVAREKAMAFLQATLVLYGEALKKMLQVLQSSPSGKETLAAMTQDEVVRTVLRIHDLIPDDLETRVIGGLDKIRPYLQSHGGEVEFLGVENGVAKLRLVGSCHTCPSSTATLKLGIEKALHEAAPDLVGIEVEGVTPPPKPEADPGLEEIKEAKLKAVGLEASSSWTPLGSLTELQRVRMKAMDINGVNLLLCHVQDRFFAYRNRCAHQQLPLDKGLLAGYTLTCPHHGYSYDIKRAGACLTNPELHLEPFPLIVEEGVIKVALPAPGAGD
ncbi:MAG: NifU family protein [Candidatus Binatia bacterium]